MKRSIIQSITLQGASYINVKTLQYNGAEDIETPIEGDEFVLNPATTNRAVVTVNPIVPNPNMGEIKSVELILRHDALPTDHEVFYRAVWDNTFNGSFENSLGEMHIALPLAQCQTDTLSLELECMSNIEFGYDCNFSGRELVLEYEYEVNHDSVTHPLPTPQGVSAEVFPGNGKIVAAFEDTTKGASPLGVSVTHVFNPDESHPNKAYGKGFRLNVDERLVPRKDFTVSTSEESALTSFDYIYTDGKGRNYGFEEYFYYMSNGERKYIGAASVSADPEGNLTYNGHEVTRELRSATGWEATTRLKDVKNVAVFEERAEEEKQLEEQMEDHKNALESYVIMDTDTGTIKEKITEPSWTKYGTKALANSEMILPASDANSYRSLKLQAVALSAQIQGCINQANAYCDQESELSHRIDSMDAQIELNELQWQSCDIQKTLNSEEKTNCEKQFDFLDVQKEYNQKLIDYYALKSNISDRYTQKVSTIPDYTTSTGTPESWLDLLNLAMCNEQNSNIEDQKTLLTKRITALTEQNSVLAQQIPYLVGPGSQDFVWESYKNSLSNDQLSRFTALQEQNESVKQNLNDQLDFCQVQLEAILACKDKYADTFKDLLITYEQLSAKLNMLRTSLPVSYMMKDGIVKGFNASGDLCVIFDRYENYVVFERTDKGLLERMSDKEGNAITFAYEGNKLISITDTMGNRVTYTYGTDRTLTKAIFSSGKEFLFAYNNTNDRLKEVVSRASRADGSASDFTKTRFTYLHERLEGAYWYSLVNSVPFEIENANKSNLLSSVTLSYRNDRTMLTDKHGNVDCYFFDGNGRFECLCREENDVVVRAERHTRTYDDTEEQNKVITLPREESVSYAAESTLHQLPLEGYVFDNADATHSIVRNAFWQTATETEIQKTKHEGETYLHESVSTYVYDDEHRLIGKNILNTQKKESDNTLIFSETVVEKYFYNASGKIIRTESYKEGKENSLGINVSETVYDKNGNAVKSFSYNTLAPSDKTYTESETDKNGRMTTSLDVTGKNKTSYTYFADGSLASESYPNGGTLAYAYDKEGNTVSVTASTKDGEGNTNTTHYTAGLVTRVESGNHVVDYEYDGKRRLTAVKLDGADYVTYIYDVDDEDYGITDATQVVFAGCSERILLTKDDHDRLTKFFIEGITMTDITYENDGRIKQMYDNYGLRSREYTYNADGLLAFYSDYRSMDAGMTYDIRGRLATKTEISRALDEQYYRTEKTVAYTYSYNELYDRVESVAASGITATPSYDALGRNTGKQILVGATVKAREEIAYLKQGDHTTTLPAVVKFKTAQGEERIKYSYDAMGNIAKISEDGIVASRYEYDALGRLTREDNRAFGKTCLWEYDENGNILSRREYAFSVKPTEELTENDPISVVEYKYDGDRLISYNGNTDFSYNALGNPTRYLGQNMTWAYGRHLSSYKGASIHLDGSNIPTRIGNVEIAHDYNGKIIADSNLHFLYDHEGALFGFVVRDTDAKYLYRRDAQGNIIAILDTSGNVVVKYKYDAWGNSLVTNVTAAATEADLGHLNPMRYRGYYFSDALGLYYLKSRFYDPEVGRFISADTVDYLAPDTINGLNLYAYCGNNPVMNVDPSGHLVITLWTLLTAIFVGAIVGGVTGAIYGGVAASMSGQNVWAGAIIGAVGGLVMGAATGLATILMAPILSGAAASVTIALKSSTITLGAWSALGAGTLLAAGSGALVGAGTEIASQLLNSGSVTNWSSVKSAALQWSLLNLETAFFGALGETSMISAFDRYTSKISSLAWGNIKTGVAVGFLGMILDYARSQE